ncbi:MAG: SDR family NAD(P)-dependent oxidoreductase [Chloroflexi bacterium]|nr:SDR family NAD(P)-dependent oxidoreductase [Chloroflexota bacterium]
MAEAVRRVALVTGAGTGIGRAVAIALAEAGYTVVLAGRREEPLRETGTMLGGAEHLMVPTDVADPASVAALFEALRDAYGRIDLLFNNAGIGAPAVPFEDLSFEDWKRVVDVNLNGAFLCAQAAIRLMQAQTPGGGRIINNGSIAAYAPRPNGAAYAATKSAITGLTRSLALDGRRMGITCGQIDIGNAATPMTEPMRAGIIQPDGSVRAEPSMDVEDVGRAVVYMASLPPDTNVLFMTVMAANMPYVGRG